MYPAEQAKLLLEVSALERQNETNETKGVQRETDESVVGGESCQLSVGEDDMLWEKLLEGARGGVPSNVP